MGKNYHLDGQLSLDFTSPTAESGKNASQEPRRRLLAVVVSNDVQPCPSAARTGSFVALHNVTKDPYSKEVTLALRTYAAKLGW